MRPGCSFLLGTAVQCASALSGYVSSDAEEDGVAEVEKRFCNKNWAGKFIEPSYCPRRELPPPGGAKVLLRFERFLDLRTGKGEKRF